MSREDWACIGIIILGIVLFLIGANVYNAFMGYLGVFLFLGGVFALIALYIYNLFWGRKASGSEENLLTT